MVVKAISSLDEFHTIIKGDKPAIIDFWAAWCGPCRMISPILERLSNDITGLDYYKVDVDDQPAISEEVGIRAMPTFMVFKDGVKQGELVGADPNALQQLVTKHVQ